MIKTATSSTESTFFKTKSSWETLFGQVEDSNNFDLAFFEKNHFFDFVDVTNSTVSIYNYRDFKPEYITENVKQIIGLTKEEYLTFGSKLMFSYAHPSNAEFPIKVSSTTQKILGNPDPHVRKNLYITVCGLKFTHPEKGNIRILLQQFFIQNNDEEIPIRAISTMRDVTHLMKDDFYYLRAIHGDKHQYQTIYHSDTSKLIASDDILSAREKEVLTLLSLGKETQEIADTLSISPNTVKNHRQNMLDRLGAKDSTALLLLAKLMHIV